jgi:hypothetical protein
MTTTRTAEAAFLAAEEALMAAQDAGATDEVLDALSVEVMRTGTIFDMARGAV